MFDPSLLFSCAWITVCIYLNAMWKRSFEHLALLPPPFGLGDNSSMWRRFKPDRGSNKNSCEKMILMWIDSKLLILLSEKGSIRTFWHENCQCLMGHPQKKIGSCNCPLELRWYGLHGPRMYQKDEFIQKRWNLKTLVKRKKIEKKNAGEEAEATKKLGIKIKEFIARLEAVVEEDADLNRNNRLTVTKLLMLREMRCVLYKKRMFVLVEYPFPGLVLDFEVPITCWTKRKY